MSSEVFLAIYFVTWWVVLLMVLPFGNCTQEDDGYVVGGSVSSAPTNPRLVLKSVVASIISLVVVIVIVVLRSYLLT